MATAAFAQEELDLEDLQLGEALYQPTAEADAAADAAAAGAADADAEDVVDADFEEVDGEKKD